MCGEYRLSARDSRAELVTPTSYLLLTSPDRADKVFFFSLASSRAEEREKSLIDRARHTGYNIFLCY